MIEPWAYGIPGNEHVGFGKIANISRLWDTFDMLHVDVLHVTDCDMYILHVILLALWKIIRQGKNGTTNRQRRKHDLLWQTTVVYSTM